MRSPTARALSMVPALLALLCLAPSTVRAQSMRALLSKIEPLVSTTGSFSIVPVDTWSSGDFEALSDSFFGYTTPRVSQMYVSMDQTASTTYEGDLFFKKLRLKAGLNVNVDDNLVGRLNSLMGYINYEGFTLRVQNSRLRGTAHWTGANLNGMMPAQASFDNSYTSVDLLHYDGGDLYFGLGYTSYSLPVQLNCLEYNVQRGEVWWPQTGAVYQPDMAFHIYSVLFGLDTLHQALAQTGQSGRAGALGIWMATQDRAGVGLSSISDQARAWVQAANPLDVKGLWSAEQIAMLVDYELILGIQWVHALGPVRLGFGLGFEIGGQVVMCVTPKGPVEALYIDASPSVYLFHYGPVLKGSVSW